MIERSPRALLLVGRDRYEDPWHDYAATGQRIAEALLSGGATLLWRSTFPDSLDSIGRPDLIAVVAGRSQEDSTGNDGDAAWSRFHNRLAEFVASGTALLALHSAANTFTDSLHWTRIIGGRWVEGISAHPPIGDAVFHTVGSHPIVSELGPVHAFDEQYCGLEVAATSQPFLEIRRAGLAHPVAWVAEPLGHGCAVYDGMGHDTRSYDSEERIALLRREISWLLATSLGHSSR